LQELREQMLQLELSVMLPLIAQRDQQLHEEVPLLRHLAQPKLGLASLLLVRELQVLQQLRERLVVSVLALPQLALPQLALPSELQ
jgi:hypothetical protein